MKYPGRASDDYDNYGEVEGVPITHKSNRSMESKSLKTWRREIREQVACQLNEGSIQPIPEGSECNLYVTFNIEERNYEVLPDIDNLVKPFLDQLKKTALMEDDRCVRGIKAQKEVVRPDEWQGAKFRYLVTKRFYIRDVIPLTVEKVQNQYSPDWKHEMYKIVAEEEYKEEGCIKVGPLCDFIDNIPGNVFSGTDSNKLGDIIPGYDWGSIEIDEDTVKSKLIDGCLVFHRKPSEPLVDEKGKPIKHWWLNKW